jgi:hypothetical protein
MRAGLLLLLLLAAPALASRWTIRRAADMPDGAPAFEIVSPEGRVTTRIGCIHNGWYDPDGLAVRFLGSTEVMATVIAQAGRLAVDDLGPAKFDCVVLPATPDPKVTP